MRTTLRHFDKLNSTATLMLWSGLLGAGIAHGQTRPPISALAIQGGTSFATWRGGVIEEREDVHDYEYGYRTGLTVRASAVRSLTRIFALEFGVGYVQKGTTIGIPASETSPQQGSEAGGRWTERTEYLELPVLLRVGTSLHDQVSPHVKGGYVASLLLVDDNDNFKALDSGIIAGVGVGIAVSGSLTLTLESLYVYSLQSIIDIGDLPIGGENFDVRNRSFSVSAGIMIPLR